MLTFIPTRDIDHYYAKGTISTTTEIHNYWRPFL